MAAIEINTSILQLMGITKDEAAILGAFGVLKRLSSKTVRNNFTAIAKQTAKAGITTVNDIITPLAALAGALGSTKQLADTVQKLVVPLMRQVKSAIASATFPPPVGAAAKATEAITTGVGVAIPIARQAAETAITKALIEALATPINITIPDVASAIPAQYIDPSIILDKVGIALGVIDQVSGIIKQIKIPNPN